MNGEGNGGMEIANLIPTMSAMAEWAGWEGTSGELKLGKSGSAFDDWCRTPKHVFCQAMVMALLTICRFMAAHGACLDRLYTIYAPFQS